MCIRDSLIIVLFLVVIFLLVISFLLLFLLLLLYLLELRLIPCLQFLWRGALGSLSCSSLIRGRHSLPKRIERTFDQVQEVLVFELVQRLRLLVDCVDDEILLLLGQIQLQSIKILQN